MTREGNRLGISDTGRDGEGEILEDACGLDAAEGEKSQSERGAQDVKPSESKWAGSVRQRWSSDWVSESSVRSILRDQRNARPGGGQRQST